MRSVVALSVGKGRRGNIRACLGFLRDEILRAFSGVEEIVLKPNMVSVYKQLCATSFEALDEVAKFFARELPDAKVVVGEIPAIGSAREGYENYGYKKLEKVEFAFPEEWEPVSYRVFNRELRV